MKCLGDLYLLIKPRKLDCDPWAKGKSGVGAPIATVCFWGAVCKLQYRKNPNRGQGCWWRRDYSSGRHKQSQFVDIILERRNWNRVNRVLQWSVVDPLWVFSKMINCPCGAWPSIARRRTTREPKFQSSQDRRPSADSQWPGERQLVL